MKKITSLLALFLLCSCFESPQRECKDFKTGKFQFDYEVNGVKKTTTFVRTENQEIDFYEGKSDTSSIKWINDCEYVIQKMNPKNMQEKKAIAMKILSTSDNSYTFEFGIVGSAEKQTGTVKKIEN